MFFKSSSKNLAPRLSTCSFTAGRISYPVTKAPSLFAVAIACKPATPAPSTKILAGLNVPEAVIIKGNILGMIDAATSTDLYPARFARELSASMF